MSSESSASGAWPPTDAAAVFLPHNKIHINAPAHIVFELLTSPSTWPDWNLFVPRAELLSRKNANGDNEAYTYDASVGEGDAKYKATPPMQLGDILHFKVGLPTSGKGPTAKRSASTTDEVVADFYVPAKGAGETYRASWAVTESYTAPRAMRHNEVWPLGDAECEYRTYEMFYGWMAWLVRLVVGKPVQTGLEEWAEGLKKAAEEKWTAQKSAE